jgi:hypothetical protein
MTILSYSSRIIKYRWRVASKRDRLSRTLYLWNHSESRAHAAFVFHGIAQRTLKELRGWWHYVVFLCWVIVVVLRDIILGLGFLTSTPTFLKIHKNKFHLKIQSEI